MLVLPAACFDNSNLENKQMNVSSRESIVVSLEYKICLLQPNVSSQKLSCNKIIDTDRIYTSIARYPQANMTNLRLDAFLG